MLESSKSQVSASNIPTGDEFLKEFREQIATYIVSVSTMKIG